jgi:hypothetical protein
MTIRNMAPIELANLTCEQMVAAILKDNDVFLRQLPPYARHNIELDILDCLQAAESRVSLSAFADIAFAINNQPRPDNA